MEQPKNNEIPEGADVLDDSPPTAVPQPVPLPAQRFEPEREPASLIDKAKLPFIVSALVFIIGIVLVGMAGGVQLVTKKDFNTNITLMNTSIGEAQASADAVSASVEASLASIPSAVNTAVATVTASVDAKIAAGIAGKADQANITTLSTSIAAASTKIATANAEIDALQTDAAANLVTITALQTDIAELRVQITALEVIQEEEIIAAQDAVQLDVTTMGYALLPNTANTSISTSFRIDLTNTTNARIDDIVLDIFVDTNVPQADAVSWSLTGGGTVWQSAGYWYAGSLEFMNTQWGLNVDAGATKRLYLTLTIVGTPDVENGVFAGDSYQYQISAEVLN